MSNQFRSSKLLSKLARYMMWIVLGGLIALAIAFLHISVKDKGSVSIPHSAQSTTPSSLSTIDWHRTWVVSSSEAIALLEQPNTILLDARGLSRRVLTHIAGAIPVHWRSFSQPEASHQGNLLPYRDPIHRQALEQKIGNLGVSEQTIVLVYGEPLHGWGEEGRIVWMLKTLGHSSVALIDGGINALITSGLETSVLPSYQTPTPRQFQIRVHSDWSATHEQVRDILAASKEPFEDSHVSLVDTREAREYLGETPYGERRGGHIPGAVHIHFKQLMSENGQLKSSEEIQNMLQVHNISPESEVIAYCTGGIRSALFVSVLNNLGYVAKNYAGSMWEWSSLPEDEYPLNTMPGNL